MGGSPVTAHAPQPEIGRTDWESEPAHCLCLRPHAIILTSPRERGTLPLGSSPACGALVPRVHDRAADPPETPIDVDVPGHDERPLGPSRHAVPERGAVLVPVP
ncbi:hypothetical protein GS876_23035 [Rhodococcus hoagii]|nr:hypothetical protein [Prescottella equi]